MQAVKEKRLCAGDFPAKNGLSCLREEKLVFAKVMRRKEPEPDLLERREVLALGKS